MAYKFSGHLLYRMPSGTPERYTHDTGVILEDRFFRAALYLASPSLYESLARAGFCAGKISAKEALSVRKYFNRFCFRPTPFGLFASVSLAVWGGETALGAGAPYKLFVEPDQSFVQALQCGADGAFIPNRTLYRVMNEYRYIHTHLLRSISCSALLKAIFRYCDRGRSGAQMTDYIEKRAGVASADARDYVDFLAGSKILVHEAGPVLTGQLPLLHQFQGRELCPEQLPDLGEGLNVTLCGTADVVAGRHYQALIHDGLRALDALCPPDRMPAMEQFISAWEKRFEGQTLPLLTALDPDYGIGYFPVAAGEQPVLLETLSVPPKNEETVDLKWTAAHRLLLESWHNSADPMVMTISPEMVDNGRDDPQMTGMSVLFRLAGDNLYLESAGGVNPAALMGRFTVADDRIHAAAREMAAAQERHSPDIIFAEIGHLANPKTDNVNRRENIWSWELPVTGGAGTGNLLRLSDLQVGVSGGKVVLRCKKNGKIVIPRLTSAYNHSADKLPLFRFLADLSYQYGRTNLSFDLGAFFPGLSFYPRVVYKKTILQLATWIIPAGRLPEALPARFSWVDGDRQLVFRRDDPADRLFFSQCVKDKKEVRITEVPDDMLPGQFSCSLYTEDPVYPGLPKTGDTAVRKFLPGSEWLYLKLYSAPAAADRVLLRVLPLLRRGLIRQWFFVRYEDGGPHLRLRMLIAPADTGAILAAFKHRLNGYVRNSLIRHYHADVYEREIERYRAAGIERTEQFFWRSSELAAAFLAKGNPDPHLFALVSVRDIMAACLAGREEQITFLSQPFTDRVQLDKKYRELSPAISAVLGDRNFYKKAGLSRAMHHCLRSVPATADQGYLASILHMHMNRLFSAGARKQEMVIYYLLYKFLLSERARLVATSRSSIRSKNRCL